MIRQQLEGHDTFASDRAKVVMTAGCISKIFDILNYIYNPREIGNFVNQNLE